MNDAVRLVLCGCFPRNVVWVATTIMASTAAVAGLVTVTWGRAIKKFAQVTVDSYPLSVHPKPSIAAMITSIGPRDAIGCVSLNQNILDVRFSFSKGSPFALDLHGVTMGFPSVVMLLAEVSTFQDLAAIWD